MANATERIGKAKGKITGKDVVGQGLGTNYKFPDNIGDKSSGGQHFMLIKAYDFSDPAMTSGTNFTPTSPPPAGSSASDTIHNPVAWSAALFIPPAALKQAYSAKYATLDYAGAVAAAAGGAEFGGPSAVGGAWTQESGGSAFGDFFQSSNKEKMTSINAMVNKVGEASMETLAAFQKKMGAGAKILQATTGAVPNSHQGVIYDGPGEFREHQFSWTMLPKNTKDAESIRNIVAKFKMSMLPGGTATEGHENYNSIDSSYWTFPDMFTIDFFINGALFPRMNIYRSVLKAMSVDFAGSESQVAFHPGGEPVGTILNLTFQETIHVTNDHIGK